jgi:putative ATPase
VRRDGVEEPPAMLRDAHYRAAAARCHGAGYVSPHEDPAAAPEEYLPERLRGRTYYRPSSTSEAAEEARRDDRNG